MALVLLRAGLSVWWLVTTPKLEGGGTAGVSSGDHEVVAATGLGESVYVVPADGHGSSTLAFGIHNRGPLAVELRDVWPGMAEPMCFWQPSVRWFQDDPRYTGVLDHRARPAVGAVLAPGASATLWITGGRTSAARIPLGYTFGYSDHPSHCATPTTTASCRLGHRPPPADPFLSSVRSRTARILRWDVEP